MRNAIIVLSVAILVAAGAIVWALSTINPNTPDQSNEDVVKEDVVTSDDEEKTDKEDSTVEEEQVEEPAEEEVKEEEVKKPVYTGANYITIDSPKNGGIFHELPIVFRGVTSPNTTKIVVHAKQDAGIATGYDDVYTLNDFKPGDTTFVYRAKPEWGNLDFGTNDFEFKAYFDDGTSKTANLTVYYTIGGAEMGKPVIYLYPEKAMDVAVNVRPNGGFSVTEPAIGRDGWSVFAQPNGELFNYDDGISYPYLFWEGFAENYRTPDEGFVVAAEKVPRFFDSKLSYLGLNHREIRDFKEFWVPRMQDDAYYFITFIDQDDFDNYAPLEVSPAPDSVIRVIFDHKGLDAPIRVREQKLEPVKRSGFAVVEWGGRL